MSNGYGGAAAQIALSPFAAAQPQAANPLAGQPAGMAGMAGGDCPTGPILGKGSELLKMYCMPHEMGHAAGVNCLALVGDKVYSGGRDEQLFTWKAIQGAHGLGLAPDIDPIDLGSSVISMFYEPSSQWLFCGLWSGDIQAFCKDPVRVDRLTGHRRSVNCLTVHSSVLVSGSHDGTVRLWTYGSNCTFSACGQPLDSPVGGVTAVRVLGESLWVGGQTGIACFDLTSLQVRGTVASAHQVTGLLEFQGHMIASYRNGDVKIFDSSGMETYVHLSCGDHTSNTAVELMMHPVENKPMLLCGQTYGYVTAYDLPEFRPRGSFFVGLPNSDVKSIVDLKSGGMFITAGNRGDIVIWQWGHTPQASHHGHHGKGGHAARVESAAVVSNPFAPAGVGAAPAVVASPFAPAPQQAQAAVAAVPGGAPMMGYPAAAQGVPGALGGMMTG